MRAGQRHRHALACERFDRAHGVADVKYAGQIVTRALLGDLRHRVPRGNWVARRRKQRRQRRIARKQRLQRVADATMSLLHRPLRHRTAKIYDAGHHGTNTDVAARRGVHRNAVLIRGKVSDRDMAFESYDVGTARLEPAGFLHHARPAPVGCDYQRGAHLSGRRGVGDVYDVDADDSPAERNTDRNRSPQRSDAPARWAASTKRRSNTSRPSAAGCRATSLE